MRWFAVLAVVCATGLGLIAANRSSPRRVGAHVSGKIHPAQEKDRARENCFRNPEGCGYPGTKDTGVANCSKLKASGAKTITDPGTIENVDINGYVVIDASGVTLNHDCVILNGGEAEGSAAVILESGATNFTIANSTVRAENTTSDSFEEAIRNNHSDPGALATKDRLEDCAECIHQLWTLNESYVNANGRAAASGVHTEDWWLSNNTISATDDTLLNPQEQTAVIFAESGGGVCENHETVTHSLIAGGGFMFYFCAHSTGPGSSSVEITHNRFARCSTKEEYVSKTGGYRCRGGSDKHGYWPKGGYFGEVGTHYRGAGQRWEKNVWDNNLKTVGGP